MNKVTTSVLLKGLEAIRKLNKTTGKLGIDSVTIEVKEGMMTLTSCYFQQQVQMVLPVDDSSDIKVGVLDVEKLVKALKKFDLYTSMEILNDNLIISDGKKRMKLPLVDVFDPVKKVEGDTFQVEATRLNDAFDKVKKTVAKDDIRPILCGIHFKNNFIESIDGYRISQVIITNQDFENDFVIGVTPLDTILSAVKKDDVELTISTLEDMYTLQAKHLDYTLSITGNLIEGDYLDTSKIFTDECEYNLTFSGGKELINELEFVKDVCNTQGNGKPSPIKYRLTNNTLNVIDMEKTVSTKVYFNQMEGEVKGEFQIAFNPNYMIDAIKNISGQFAMQFTTALTPIVIKNEKERYLVLPIRY